MLLQTLDTSREYLSGKIIDFAGTVDSFFGDDRNYQESNESVLQLDLVRLAGYGGNSRFALTGRAKLHLPTAEKKLHLLLESDPENNVTTQPAQGQPVLSNQVTAPTSYATALRYENQEDGIWHFSTDAGVKVHTPLQPYARARGSYSVPLDLWRMKLAETLFWFKTIGAGESTQLDLERMLSEPVLFRSTTSATWLKDTQNFGMRQDLTIFHTLGERAALQYQASAVALSNPQFEVTEYVVSALYRYRLHRNWMFLELSPQLHFPKIEAYHTRTAIGLRLEMLFDREQ